MMVGVSVSIFQTIWPFILATSLDVDLWLLAQNDELASTRVLSKCFQQLRLGNLSEAQ